MTIRRTMLPVAILLAPLGLAVSDCGGRLSLPAAEDAGAGVGMGSGSSGAGATSSGSGSGSGSGGSTSSSSGSGSSSGVSTQDAGACVPPYIGPAACDACTAQQCPGTGGWCSCAQDPMLGPSGVPGCVSYLECELKCIQAGGDIGNCPAQCAPGYSQAEQVAANSLLMCLTSQCSSPCNLPGAGSSSSGGPVDAGDDAPAKSGADAGACAAQPSQGQCFSCCQNDDSAGAASFFSDVAACLCNGGPCTTACAAQGDYCASPGTITSQGCQTCAQTYTAAGAQCDVQSGTVVATCQSQPSCAAYLACANGCP